MKRHVVKRILAIIGLTTVATVVVGNGCSGEFSAVTGSASSSSTADTQAADSGMEVIPGTKTASLVYSNQVLTQLTSCAGVAQPSDATVAMYESKKGSISTYGAANTITAPMMMAITSIAGEVCNDLINQEIASGGRIFMNVDLNASSLASQNLLADSVSRLALSCWQRNETNSERDTILNMINENVGATEASAGRKSALMICTSVLSSLDALLN